MKKYEKAQDPGESHKRTHRTEPKASMAKPPVASFNLGKQCTSTMKHNLRAFSGRTIGGSVMHLQTSEPPLNRQFKSCKKVTVGGWLNIKAYSDKDTVKRIYA